MLSDRDYMRSDYPRQPTSSLVWLLAGTGAAFCLQLLLGSPRFSWGEGLLAQLPLTVRSLQSGHLWTLATHALLLRTDQPFSILATLLGLVFIGRELEPILGRRKFLALYAGSILTGGLTWTAVHWTNGGVLIGPGAGILGLLVVLACMYPNQEIRFLLMFLFPVTLRPVYLVAALLVLESAWLIVYEIPGGAAPFSLSASAHLGGMLAGWIFYRGFHANNGWDRAASLELPGWLRRSGRPRAATGGLNPPAARTSAELKAQVDRVLDKINSQGFGALTEEEKRLLDEAKDLLSRQ